MLGAPHRIDSERGLALTFNGEGDGMFISTHPLQEAKQFTAEIVFRPKEGGEREQRFLHMQESGSENRIMFETRLVGDDRWFLDTFILTGDGESKIGNALSLPKNSHIGWGLGTTLLWWSTGNRCGITLMASSK